MSTKKLLLRKKILKRWINAYKRFREDDIVLPRWKKNLALIHSFSKCPSTNDSIAIFLDGYLLYQSHFIFFEIFAESECNLCFNLPAKVIYKPERQQFKSLKYACHTFKFFTSLKAITVHNLFSALTFIENWIDSQKNILLEAEDHALILPPHGLVIADKNEGEWINS